MNLLRRILCPAGAVCSAAALAAPINLNHPTAFSYTQNFDALTSSSAAWTDDSTLPGWYAQAVNGFGGDYTANAGTGTAGDLYNYGATGNAERALGSLASATPSHFAYGVQLQNTSGSTISDLAVSYRGEQWRNNGNITAQSLTFSYRISGSPITDLEPATAPGGTWIAVTALEFFSLQNTSSASALDGNAAANSQALSFVLSGLGLDHGEYLMLRWRDLNDDGNDHGLAIDNFSVAVPEAGTTGAAALIAALAGGAWWRCRRAKSPPV